MSAAAIDYRQFIEPVVEYRLYNPSPNPIEGQHNGRFYTVPARDEFYFDPVTKARYPEPGVLPIRGYTYVEKLSSREIEQRTITAKQIVQHLTGDDGVTGKIGKSGIRLLPPPGDDRADAVKREALEAYESKTYEDAGYTIAAFEAENAKRIEAKVPPKPPNPRVREAYRFRADVDMKGNIARAAFSCPRCYEGIPTEALLRDHIETIHAQYAVTLLKAASLEPVDDDDEDVPVAPVKRGPGRPKKIQPEA